MKTKPIGITVREACKGWTYSMMVMVQDSEGEYPDCEWTGPAFESYEQAWNAAYREAYELKVPLLSKKKTQAQLDEEKARQEKMQRRIKTMARLAREAISEIKVNDCPSCGERGGDILCDECAKTVGVSTGEPQHEPR